MNHKAHLKNWLKTNEKYFEANPRVLQSLLENPNFLASLNERMLNRRNRLVKRVAKMERRSAAAAAPQVALKTAGSAKRRRFRLPKLPSLSSVNQRLHQANDLLHTIKSLTSGM